MGLAIATDPRPRGLRRIAPALGLFLLAPMSAEYLVGYDTSTGDPGELLAGLLVLAPLYGGPAVIIREVARRSGRGWPCMLLLGLAFGVVQAGLVDHSLFNDSYRDIDYWDAMLLPSYIPSLGIGASMALSFVVGHAIWSIGAPIAIVEAITARRGPSPWLGRPGLAVVAVLYALASALIVVIHVREEQFLPTTPQLIGAASVAIGLIVAAFAAGRRPASPDPRPAPSPWAVGVAPFAAFSLTPVLDGVLDESGVATGFEAGWWGFVTSVALLAALAVAADRWSRRAGWDDVHRASLAGGALLTHAWFGFLVEPLGDVAPAAKLAHNAGFALGVVALLALAVLRARGARRWRAARDLE